MASPCTVTAHLQTADDQGLQGNAFVRFRLRNFSGFVPRIVGTSIIAETQIDSLPDNTGLVTVTLWGNDNIDPSGTFYTVEWWNNGRITSQGNFLITGASLALDSASQLNPPASTAQTFLTASNLLLINSQTGTSYTLVISDMGLLIEMNNASANTLTIPPNSSVSFPVGAIITVRQMGAGQTTIAPGAGVTLLTPETALLRKQYATVTLHQRAANVWCLEGDLQVAP